MKTVNEIGLEFLKEIFSRNVEVRTIEVEKENGSVVTHTETKVHIETGCGFDVLADMGILSREDVIHMLNQIDDPYEGDYTFIVTCDELTFEELVELGEQDRRHIQGLLTRSGAIAVNAPAPAMIEYDELEGDIDPIVRINRKLGDRPVLVQSHKSGRLGSDSHTSQSPIKDRGNNHRGEDLQGKEEKKVPLKELKPHQMRHINPIAIRAVSQ